MNKSLPSSEFIPNENKNSLEINSNENNSIQKNSSYNNNTTTTSPTTTDFNNQLLQPKMCNSILKNSPKYIKEHFQPKEEHMTTLEEQLKARRQFDDTKKRIHKYEIDLYKLEKLLLLYKDNDDDIIYDSTIMNLNVAKKASEFSVKKLFFSHFSSTQSCCPVDFAQFSYACLHNDSR